MSNDPKRPSQPTQVVATFGQVNPFRTPPGRPRRELAVLEELVETAVTKLALVEQSIARIEQNGATKEDVQAVYLEARQARRLLEQHLQHSELEFKAARIRDEAILSMLGDLITRLPESGRSLPATDLEPPSSKPSKPPSIEPDTSATPGSRST